MEYCENAIQHWIFQMAGPVQRRGEVCSPEKQNADKNRLSRLTRLNYNLVGHVPCGLTKTLASTNRAGRPRPYEFT